VLQQSLDIQVVSCVGRYIAVLPDQRQPHDVRRSTTTSRNVLSGDLNTSRFWDRGILNNDKILNDVITTPTIPEQVS